MENVLKVDEDGRVFLNGVEVPFAELVDVRVASSEVMTATIKCYVSKVDIPRYPPISMIK